jgi:hypothetical protein
MRFTIFMLFLFISSPSCNEENEAKVEEKIVDIATEISFDKEQWSTKKGQTFPSREKMLNNVIYNDSLRSLKRTELLEQLGEPLRTNNEYVYYLIEKNKALFMTLRTRTLVIKFKEDDTVEWMKIHE